MPAAPEPRLLPGGAFNAFDAIVQFDPSRLTLLQANPISAQIGPAGLRLEAPRPNPRRGSAPATVDFTLPRADDVVLELLDAAGRCV